MHIIRDPLISFTACQGFADWLDQQPLFKELGLKSVPNQLYLWGLSYTLFQVQAAVPVSDSAGAFDRIQKIWVPKSNPVLAEYAVGKMDRLTNQTEIVWRGLPIIVPYLEPARDSGQEYLRAGIFPITQPTNPPPAALFEQLTSQTNLVYYDWEITQARLNQLRPLLQLGSVFLNIAPMSTNSAAFKWLDAIEPKLGNAATEVTQTSPRELKLVRTSHIGLNGLEILALANWLEGTNFPHIDVGMHFRPVLRASHPKPTR